MTVEHEPDLVPLYRATVVPVYRYLSRLTGGDRALAEDLTQEVFAAALDATRRGRPEPVALGWLLVTARNAFLQRLRTTSRRERREVRAAAGPAGTHDAVETGAADRDLARRLLATLSPDQRTVFVLRHVDDLTVKQIAALVGRSPRATQSLLVRADARLRAEAATEGTR